ncbi:CYTH domain protein [compost metagenome]
MIEIERKFRIDETLFLDTYYHQQTSEEIIQGYLNLDPNRTVRVRLAGLKGFITVKGKSSDDGLSRFEWEKEISQYDAQQMLKLCVGVIAKTRLTVLIDGKVWEIDAFHDDNEGLVVAEIELTSVDEPIKLPAWITKEVTGDPKYYNSNLITNPYKNWLTRDIA